MYYYVIILFAMILTFYAYIAATMFVANAAKKAGHSWWLWFIISFTLSPIRGGVLLIVDKLISKEY